MTFRQRDFHVGSAAFARRGLGLYLQSLRRRYEISFSDMAEAMGVAPGMLFAYETGRRPWPVHLSRAGRVLVRGQSHE